MVALLEGSALNFHGIASLTLSFSSLILGVFVYLKGRNRPANVTYALVALSVSLWCFAQFMGEISPDRAAALFWTRINLAGGIMALVFFVHFVIVFLGKLSARRWVLILAYLMGGVYLILDATPLFVAGVESRLMFRFYPVPGPTYPFFILLFAFCVGYGVFELSRALSAGRGAFRNQVMYLLLSSIIGFAGAATLFMPVFGIDIYPIGYYFVPAYIFLGVYAIVKHRLLDITFVLRKGLVYSTLVLLLSVLYLGSVYVSGEIFKTFTGGGSAAVTILVLFVFAAAFNPLRERIQASVDGLFFKNKYDFGATVKEISDASKFILDLNELLKQVLAKVVDVLGAESGAIFLKDEGGKYNLMGSINYQLDQTKGLGSLPRRLQVEGTVMTRGDLKGLTPPGLEICAPLLLKNSLIGILGLGGKRSEDDYNDEDISLLMTLSNHLTFAVENATLHEEVLEKERALSRADKLASLGTLSAGMAHEIKNPLAVIKGLTQSLHENMKNGEFLKDVCEIVPRQLERINNLVEDLVSFSKPRKLSREKVDINSILGELAKMLNSECERKGVKLVVDLSNDVPEVMADGELLTQAFLNLMLNGIQAMDPGGALNVRSRGKRVEIEDSGCGISPQNLPRIFDPFFTTRDKGTGLGLAVTHRIIAEHGGDVRVESREGVGTKFTVNLP